MNAPSADVTAVLKAWRGGDQHALDRLTPLVRPLAPTRTTVCAERACRRPEDATSLVHEAFARLVDARTIDWQDRAQFLAVSATIMRRILVDAARARASTKRGGGMQRVEHTSALNLDALPGANTNRAAEMCALDDALSALAKREPRRAQVIELRYFGGLTVDETADTLGVSPQTVMRDWKLARAWLAVELRRS